MQNEQAQANGHKSGKRSARAVAAIAAPTAAVEATKTVPLSEAAPKGANRPPSLKVRSYNAKTKACVTEPNIDDGYPWDQWYPRYLAAHGTTTEGSARLLSGQIISSEPWPETKEEVESRMNIAIARMAGIAPRDDAEGLMAAQMIAVHDAAMHWIGIARRCQTVRTFDYMLHATRLMRTYAAQLEALKCYRSKGQQVVVVKRIVVEEGGQAMVGNVNPRGSGVDENNET